MKKARWARPMTVGVALLAAAAAAARHGAGRDRWTHSR